MKEYKRLLSDHTYKGFELASFLKFFESRELLILNIDAILHEHPEYLGDTANMFRLLSQNKGMGKSHCSGYKEGEIRKGVFGIRTGARGKRR